MSSSGAFGRIRGVTSNTAIQATGCLVAPRAYARVAPIHPAPDRHR